MRPNGSSNNGYSQSQNGYYVKRGRLLSMNTPKLSPLRMIQSPFPIGQ